MLIDSDVLTGPLNLSDKIIFKLDFSRIYYKQINRRDMLLACLYILQIMINNFKTIFLLGLLSLFFIFVGSWIGGRQGVIDAFLISLLINGISYFFSDKIALSSSGAKPVSRNQAPELYVSVSDVARKMNIPLPKLYLIPEQQINAFATGRSPENASVAVTEGAMRMLNDDELKGVIAHELGHVKNRDILIASVAAVLASAVSFLARMGMYGGFGGNSRDREGGGAGSLLLVILAPIAALLIQMAISRSREYEADETGAKVLGSGMPLAHALEKIDRSVKILPAQNLNPAFSSLYIDNPFGGLGSSLLNLFSTHPPVAERIKRLEKIG